MNLKQELIKELDANEHIVQIIPLDDLVTEWESKKGIAKDIANYTSPIKDSYTASKLLREFGLAGGRVAIRYYGAKYYVIFKGYPGNRKIFRGTRYLASNSKIIRMAIGPKGIVKSVKGGFVLSVVLCGAVNVFDYFIRDQATLSLLLGNITSDIVKVGLSSIAAVAAGLAAGTVTVLSGIAAAPLIIAIGVGVLTGYFLEKIDENVGATKALIDAYEQSGIALDQAITTISNIPNEIGKEVNRFERGLINRAIGNALQY